jgi:hypothetical protein
LNYKCGTVFVKLFEVFQKEGKDKKMDIKKVCVAQRNLDPFTAIDLEDINQIYNT